MYYYSYLNEYIFYNKKQLNILQFFIKKYYLSNIVLNYNFCKKSILHLFSKILLLRLLRHLASKYLSLSWTLYYIWYLISLLPQICFTFIHAYFRVSRKVPLVFWGKMRKMMPRLEISSTMRKSTTSWKMMMMTSKLFHFSILDRISCGFPGPARVFPICIVIALVLQ